MRILIIEDSVLVQKMYGLAFSQRSHVLVTATNGRDALATLEAESEPFDLILLDLRMPDMNGVEFLAALHRHPTAPPPVVLTTAEPADSPLIREAQTLGIAAVVHKPWKPLELREVVRQLVPEALS